MEIEWILIKRYKIKQIKISASMLSCFGIKIGIQM